MQFNPSKCQVIHITRPPSPLPTNYTQHGETLEEVVSPRYLGVDIANDPSWKTHISRITNAANKSLGFLRNNLRTQNTSLREMHTKPLSDPIWSMLLQYGTPTLRMTYIKLKEFRDEQPDGSLGIIPPNSCVTDMIGKLRWRNLKQSHSDSRMVLFIRLSMAT